MKSILILLFSLVSFSVFSQDTSSTFYKNQIGIDILPTAVGLAADNQSPFSRVELTYRRAFSLKYYGAFRLEMNYGDTRNIDYRYDTLSVDTSVMISTLTGYNYNELSFVFSRKFHYKKVKLYGGIILGIAGISSVETSRTQQTFTIPNEYNVIHSDDVTIPMISYGLELGAEVPIAKRWSLLFNLHTIFREDTGNWKLINSDGDLITSSVRSSEYFEFFRLSNLMVLYQF